MKTHRGLFIHKGLNSYYQHSISDFSSWYYSKRTGNMPETGSWANVMVIEQTGQDCSVSFCRDRMKKLEKKGDKRWDW